MRTLGLNTKITGIVVLTIVATVAVASFTAFCYYAMESRKIVAGHQFSMVSAISEQLDEDLKLALSQIVAIAGKLDADLLKDAERANTYLAQQTEILQTFDNGLYLFSKRGDILAGTGVEESMRKKNYFFREYFQVTVRKGKAYISEPIVSDQKHRHPVIMLTAPVYDRSGNVEAIVAGSLDLTKKNILGLLADRRLAKNGRIYIFSPDGTLLFHPDRTLILRQHIPVKEDPFLNRVVAGYEGSGEYVDYGGLHFLGSFKRLQSTGWILAMDSPKEKAYAPIVRAKRYMLSGIAWFLLVPLIVTFYCVKRLTRPLGKITEHARKVTSGCTDLPPLEISGKDEIGMLAATFNEMLARVESQKQIIFEQKEFAETLLKNSAIPIFAVDTSHKVISWNNACEKLTGIRKEEIVGTDKHWQAFYEEPRPCLADIIINQDSENVTSFYGPDFKVWFSEGCLHAEGWRTIKGRGKHYLIFRAVPIRDKQGNVIAAIETLENYTERAEAEEKMRCLAHFDQLTGLPNRTLFFDRLRQGISEAARYGHKIALMFLDLNGFKQINDCMGHDIGDHALIEVAKRLRSCIRECDIVARMGGDEFTVILTKVAGPGDAVATAKRILEALNVPVILSERSFELGASIGISLYPDHGSDANTLVKNADTAMYAIKSEGKNQHLLFNEGICIFPGGATC